MKIWKKILLGFLSTIVILILVDVRALRNNIKIIDGIHRLEHTQQVELNESYSMAFSLQLINSHLRELFIEHGEEDQLSELAHVKEELATRLPMLSASLKAINKATELGYHIDNEDDKEGELFELKQIDSLNAKISSFILDAKRIMELLNENRLHEADELFENKVEPNSNQIQEILTFLTDDASNEMKEAIREMDLYVKKAIKSGVYLTLLSVFFALGIGLLISRSISIPLQLLTKGAKSIGKGDLETNVEVNSNDELGSLARSFNQMTKELKIKMDAIDKLNRELTEANETKNKFFSIVAHDLKNPFNAILGYSNVLANQYDSFSEEDRKTFVGYIEESAKTTFELLENLLLWARSQMDRINITKEVLNLKEITNSAIAAYIPGAEKKQLTFAVNISDKLILQADKFTLMTVISNLFSNAIKFTPEKGHIEIRALRKNKAIQISVADNGVGIANDTIPKLFRIEKSASTAGTNQEKGSGLGLLLCKEFVEKNGGKIWVDSELGKGTTFTFSIPD